MSIKPVTFGPSLAPFVASTHRHKGQQPNLPVFYNECDIRLLWRNENIRNLVDYYITDMFKLCPGLKAAFIRQIDNLCSSNLSNEKIFEELRTYFIGLLEHKELRESIELDKVTYLKRKISQIKLLLNGHSPASFLDIGYGDGEITTELMNHLKLPKDKVTGLEVFSRDFDFPFTRVIYDGIRIPLKDNSQELITLFSVLHHSDKPELLIKDIHRVMHPNGRLIIRDTDAQTEETKLFNLVFDHLFYKVFTDLKEAPIPGNYLGMAEWIDMLKRNGFALENDPSVEVSSAYKPFFLVLHHLH